MMNRMLQWIMAAEFIIVATNVNSQANAGLQAAALQSQSGDRTNTNSVVIPFKEERGHVMLAARLNGGRQVSLMVDTGYGLTMLHPDIAEQLGLRRRGKVTIVGIGGEEDADMFEGAVLDFGGFPYTPRRVAALPSDRERSRRRDGVLGSGFFRRFVVEIDPKRSTVTLHEPATFQYPLQSNAKSAAIPLTFRRDTPVLEASIVLTNGQTVVGKFELDTGCDGGLCLASDFVTAHNLADLSGRKSRRAGIGGGRGIVSGTVPELRLGQLKVTKPSASFFTDGSPADPGMAGHLGWDALRHFTVIIHYERRRLILEQP
jgi:hypothetical protein